MPNHSLTVLFPASLLSFSLLVTGCDGRLEVEHDGGEVDGAIEASTSPVDGGDARPPIDANEMDAHTASEAGATDSEAGVTEAGIADAGATDAGPDTGVGEAGVDGSPGQDAGQDAEFIEAGFEAGTPATLSFVLYSEELVQGDPKKGLAADDEEQVYVSDGESVHVVTGTTVDTYLTREDVSTMTGTPPYLINLDDVGCSPSGDLFILTGSVSSSDIISSTTAHAGEIFRTVSAAGWPRRLSVGSPDLIGVITPSHGLSAITPEGATYLYADDAPFFWNNCGSEDLVVLASGIFMYAPGCTGGPYVIRGTMDGAGLEMMNPVDPISQAAIKPMCLARGPAGGFYAIMRENQNKSLRYFAPNFTETSGHWVVPTTPPLDSVDWNSTHNCEMAVAPTGTIFFMVYGNLWRIDP